MLAVIDCQQLHTFLSTLLPVPCRISHPFPFTFSLHTTPKCPKGRRNLGRDNTTDDIHRHLTPYLLFKRPSLKMDPTNNVMGAEKSAAKKRRHRAPRKKRNRRPSFAPSGETTHYQSPLSRVDTQPNEGDEDTKNPSPTETRSHPFYNLRRAGGGNLSETSLESEALLDHR